MSAPFHSPRWNSVMHYYAYFRVSTVKQTLENQHHEIKEWCRRNNIADYEIVEETVTGTKSPKLRKLGGLLKRMKRGDVLVCSELSRLGRSIYMISSILGNCLNRGIVVQTVKENFRLDDSLTSKVLAFALGLVAEIERDLIAQRTREALTRCKAEGIRLGRPPLELSPALVARVLEMRRSNMTLSAISSEVGVSLHHVRKCLYSGV